MSRPLRAAVVGVGHLGRHHARIYASLDGCRLVGVADRNSARAREIAEPLGAEAWDDPAALAGRVDLASVATPTEAHADVAIPLLEAGIHVLVEKPLAADLAQADAIVRAAESAGRVLMVGHSERFHPAVVALQRAVDAPRFIEVHRLAGFSARSTDIDVVMDLMIHDLDLLLHLDGGEIESVDAVGVAALTDRVDIANARVRTSTGCVANLTASRISADPIRRLRIFQSRTYLSCDTLAKTCERYRLVATGGERPEIRHDVLPVEDAEPLALELGAFVESVREGRTPPVEGRAGRRAMELAFRVREAIDASLRRVGPVPPSG